MVPSKDKDIKQYYDHLFVEHHLSIFGALSIAMPRIFLAFRSLLERSQTAVAIRRSRPSLGSPRHHLFRRRKRRRVDDAANRSFLLFACLFVCLWFCLCCCIYVTTPIVVRWNRKRSNDAIPRKDAERYSSKYTLQWKHYLRVFWLCESEEVSKTFYSYTEVKLLCFLLSWTLLSCFPLTFFPCL